MAKLDVEMGLLGKETNSIEALHWRTMFLSRAKLKASSQTSALLAGFAMVALVELDLDSDVVAKVGNVWLFTYAICTALLVSVHLLALMMSTCILPHLDAISNTQGDTPISQSPHERLKWYIELAWFFSTVLGLFLFLLEVAILFWFKLTPLNHNAGIITTAMLVPVGLVFFAFTVTFYRKLALHRYEKTRDEVDKIYSQLTRMGSITAPNPPASP